MIIMSQIEHWDQISDVSINIPSTLRYRHPQQNPTGRTTLEFKGYRLRESIAPKLKL